MAKVTPVCLRFVTLTLSFLFLAGFHTSAGVVKINKLQTYKQSVNPEIVDNYLFATYFTNAKKAYNLRGFEIGSPGNKIHDLKINPAGYSFAMLYGKPRKTAVRIQSFNPARNIKEDLKGLIAPTAICYMPDSRQIAIADDGKIKFYNSKNYQVDIPYDKENDILEEKLSDNAFLSELGGMYPSLNFNYVQLIVLWILIGIGKVSVYYNRFIEIYNSVLVYLVKFRQYWYHLFDSFDRYLSTLTYPAFRFLKISCKNSFSEWITIKLTAYIVIVSTISIVNKLFEDCICIQI